MIRIFFFAFMLFFGLNALTVSVSGAESGSTDSGTSIPADTVAELSLKTVNVLDSTNIRVTFSEDIDITSIVLKISKQSDSSAVTIGNVKAVEDAPDDIDVELDTELEEGSSYTLTVLAAVAKGGATIIDGAGALREFVTPSPLKKAVTQLNAPANPTAVMNPPVSETKNEEVTEKTIASDVKNDEEEEETPVPTEELPLTGMNSLFFLLLAFFLAYIFLKKKAA